MAMEPVIGTTERTKQVNYDTAVSSARYLIKRLWRSPDLPYGHPSFSRQGH